MICLKHVRVSVDVGRSVAVLVLLIDVLVLPKIADVLLLVLLVHLCAACEDRSRCQMLSDKATFHFQGYLLVIRKI